MSGPTVSLAGSSESRAASLHPRSLLWRAEDGRTDHGPLLLDTHVWIWMLDGDTSRMTPGVVPLLRGSAAAGSLHVCDVSYWEVAMLTEKRKLELSVDASLWLRKAEQAPGVAELPLARDILIQSRRLTGEVHGDPADRMLIAAAQLHGLSLVTIDKWIIDYAAAQPGIPVCDARPLNSNSESRRSEMREA